MDKYILNMNGAGVDMNMLLPEGGWDPADPNAFAGLNLGYQP